MLLSRLNKTVFIVQGPLPNNLKHRANRETFQESENKIP